MSGILIVRCDKCECTAEFDPWLFPANARGRDWEVQYQQEKLIARCSDCAPRVVPPLATSDLAEKGPPIPLCGERPALPPPTGPGVERARALFDLIHGYELGEKRSK